MRRSLLSAAALLTAFAMPLVAVAPASATSPDLSSFTYDCDTTDWRPYPYEIPLYESSVSVTFANCPSDYTLGDPANTGNASTLAGTIDSDGWREIGTVTAVDEVLVYVLDEIGDTYASLSFIDPYLMPNPSGVQLENSSQDIDSDAPVADWGTSRQIANGNEISIGGIEGCEIKPGEHVYATQSFTVSIAGEYTFRVTGVDPVSGYFDPLADITASELDDPMLALYSTFNTLDPADNIVGCNDDLNDLEFGGQDYGDNDFNLTAQGDFVEGHKSYFTTTLDPGDYMLVFTTWDNISGADWAEETPDGGTVYFDLWGPAGGLDLTDVPPISVAPPADPKSLAATGVDPSFGLWSALFLVGAGAAILIARRRHDRV